MVTGRSRVHDDAATRTAAPAPRAFALRGNVVGAAFILFLSDKAVLVGLVHSRVRWFVFRYSGTSGTVSTGRDVDSWRSRSRVRG